MKKKNWVVLVAFNRLKKLLCRFPDFVLWGQSLLEINSKLLDILWIDFHFVTLAPPICLICNLIFFRFVKSSTITLIRTEPLSGYSFKLAT